MNIRPMTTEDYDAVVKIWQTAEIDFCSVGRESRQAIEKQIAEFPTLTLVAQDNGDIVGVVLGTHDHRKGWINRLAVSPEYRRRGVAAVLLSRVETEFKALGIEVYAALVKAENDASAAFFERRGYSTMENVRYFSKRTRPTA